MMNLHRDKPAGCQLVKYSNKEGIMTQTGTGNAMIALNTLNVKELLLIPNDIISLLADAEVGEDFAEDGIGGDFAGDFAKPVETFADVLVKQVAT